ncbi:DUF6924 domain-containing protein [Paenarthrobacter nitroguajacolicus]
MDRAALGPGFPILVVDLDEESRPPFRCMASELYSIDNNLNIGNMDWEEFAEEAGNDGISGASDSMAGLTPGNV